MNLVSLTCFLRYGRRLVTISLIWGEEFGEKMVPMNPNFDL